MTIKVVLNPYILQLLKNIVECLLFELQAEEGYDADVIPSFYWNILKKQQFNINHIQLVLSKIESRIIQEKFYQEWNCYDDETFFDDKDIDLLLKLTELYLMRYNNKQYRSQEKKTVEDLIIELKRVLNDQYFQ